MFLAKTNTLFTWAQGLSVFWTMTPKYFVAMPCGVEHEYRFGLGTARLGSKCRCWLFEAFKTMQCFAAQSAFFSRSNWMISAIVILRFILKLSAKILQRSCSSSSRALLITMKNSGPMTNLSGNHWEPELPWIGHCRYALCSTHEQVTYLGNQVVGDT